MRMLEQVIKNIISERIVRFVRYVKKIFREAGMRKRGNYSLRKLDKSIEAGLIYSEERKRYMEI